MPLVVKLYKHADGDTALLAEHAFDVDYVTVGRGHAILFGFRPQYRGQSMNTQPLLWGAILR